MAKKLVFLSSIFHFFVHRGPISAQKVPLYAIFSKNPNRIFSNMPRADVWGLVMDSRQSALLRHFFWGGSARGMRDFETVGATESKLHSTLRFFKGD